MISRNAPGHNTTPRGLVANPIRFATAGQKHSIGNKTGTGTEGKEETALEDSPTRFPVRLCPRIIRDRLYVAWKAKGGEALSFRDICTRIHARHGDSHAPAFIDYTSSNFVRPLGGECVS